MLGPALTQLLGRLAVIAPYERTKEQEALFTELRLLFLALPGRPRPAHAELDADLRKFLTPAHQEKLFAMTEPYDPQPVTGAERCRNCQQIFPVTSQP